MKSTQQRAELGMQESPTSLLDKLLGSLEPRGAPSSCYQFLKLPRKATPHIRMAGSKKSDSNKCWRETWSNWNSRTLLARMESGAAALESLEDPHAQSYHMTQQVHS